MIQLHHSVFSTVKVCWRSVWFQLKLTAAHSHEGFLASPRSGTPQGIRPEPLPTFYSGAIRHGNPWNPGQLTAT